MTSEIWYTLQSGFNMRDNLGLAKTMKTSGSWRFKEGFLDAHGGLIWLIQVIFWNTWVTNTTDDLPTETGFRHSPSDDHFSGCPVVSPCASCFRVFRFTVVAFSPPFNFLSTLRPPATSRKGELQKEHVNNWTGDCIPSSNWHMSCKAPFFAGHFAKPFKKPRCFYGFFPWFPYIPPLHLATDDYTMRPGISKFETQKDGRNLANHLTRMKPCKRNEISNLISTISTGFHAGFLNHQQYHQFTLLACTLTW